MNFGDENFAKFSRITRNICKSIHSGHIDIQKLNTFLDELNSLDYKNTLFVAIDDATALITSLTVYIKPIDSFSAAKAAHLIFSLIGKQRLSLRPDCLRHTLTWIMKCITECVDIVLADILQTLHILLQSHSQQTPEFCRELLGDNSILLSLIENYAIRPRQVLSSSNLHYEAILTSLKCLQTLTLQGDGIRGTEDASSSSDLDNLRRISDVVIRYLYIGIQKDQDEFNYCKCVLYSLRILSQICMSNNGLDRRLQDTVGLGRSFMTFGLDNQLLTLQRITPSQQVIAEPSSQNAKGGKKARVRKQRNSAVDGLKKDIPLSDKSLLKEIDIKDNARTYTPVNQCTFVNRVNEFQMSSWPATSDSDASDNENSRDAKLKVLKARVRQGAINLLLVLIKMTDKRDMFGYWWALLPTCHDMDNWEKEDGSRRTLPYVAIADPSAAGRAAAFGAILALLTGSRLYLAQAEITKRTITSFTPFSVTLGHAVSCLHVVLCGALESERTSCACVAALKVSAALLQATPYHRLQPGLLPPLVKQARKYLVHRNVTVQVAALIVIGCVLSIDPVVDDVLKSIAKDEVDSLHLKARDATDNKDLEDDEDGFEFEEGYSDDEIFTTHKIDAEPGIEDDKMNANGHGNSTPEFKTWILDICLKNLGWITKDEKLVICQPAAVNICLESLQVLSALAFHHFPLVQPHLVLLTRVLCQTLDSDHDEVLLQALKCVSSIGDAMQKLEQSQVALPPLSECVLVWSSLLRGPLTARLQARGNPAAKAVACDCVANVGDRVFHELERNLQVLCVTLLFGSCTDEDALVRAAAVRALAMCVTFKTLREDICFVSDCGESILRVLKEPTQAVRVKAAWSLGNLSDALTLNMSDPTLESVDDDLLLRLLETSIQCSTENDKIKMNSTRAIGNLLRLITKEQLTSNARFKSLAEKALERLVECACKVSNVKIRWNACYAIGNTLKSELLYAGLDGCQKKVLSSLCGLASDCRNLKVRINAAVALRCPATRRHYGPHLPLVWRGLMAAIDNAANVDDFTEFKHKDNLIEQLCVSLSHVCCLLLAPDLLELRDCLQVHGACARQAMAGLRARLPPQHAAGVALLHALHHTTQLHVHTLTDTQAHALTMLTDIFVWET